VPPAEPGAIEVRIVGVEDRELLTHVAPEVFDNPLDPGWTAEFLRDPRLHLAVALEGDTVVGFASGMHYPHPDKPPELFINEVGVAPSHRGRGVARQVLSVLLALGRKLGCREAWVLTSRRNEPAMRLYAGLGGQDASEKDQVMFTFHLNQLETPEE
jgi:ribosomal protein S18 acetylase RimI-like enzyme